MTKAFIIKDTFPCYVTYLYRVEADNEDDALEGYYSSQAESIGHVVGDTIGFLDHGTVEVSLEAAPQEGENNNRNKETE